jgi:hypothetical protein
MCGVCVHRQLTFDTREVVLPTVPLGVPSRARFYVVNTGYDYLELRHRIPAENGPAQVRSHSVAPRAVPPPVSFPLSSSPVQIPLKIAFPDGNVVSIAKSRLPVDVWFTSKRPLAFTAMVEFFDDSANKFCMPVSGVCDNSLLTVYPYLEGNRADLVISAPPTSGARVHATLHS